jgi:hypothetical protein
MTPLSRPLQSSLFYGPNSHFAVPSIIGIPPDVQQTDLRSKLASAGVFPWCFPGPSKPSLTYRNYWNCLRSPLASSKGRGGRSRGRRTARTTTDRHNYHDPVSSTQPALALMAEPAVTFSLAAAISGSAFLMARLAWCDAVTRRYVFCNDVSRRPNSVTCGCVHPTPIPFAAKGPKNRWSLNTQMLKIVVVLATHWPSPATACGCQSTRTT